MTATLGFDTRQRGTPTRSFSCFVIDGSGRVLLTRHTVSGPWAHAVVGAARTAEPMARAVARTARDRLGLTLVDAWCVLPSSPTSPPVYVAEVAGSPIAPAPYGVVAFRWVDPEDLGRAAVAAPWALGDDLVADVVRLADAEPVGPSAELAG